MRAKQKAVSLLPTSVFDLLCLYLPVVDVFSHYLGPFVQAAFHSKKAGSSRCERGLWAWTPCHSYYCYHSSETSLVEVWLCGICSAVLTVSMLNVGSGMLVEWKCGKGSEVQCLARWLAPKGAALANEVLSCCGARCLRSQDWDLLLQWIRCSGLAAVLCSGRYVVYCIFKKSIQNFQCSI